MKKIDINNILYNKSSAMIIPVRCVTCNKILGNKWKYYKEKIDFHENKNKNKNITKENLKVENELDIYFTDNYAGKVLDELGLTKLCCRRHMLTHIDLIDII